MLKIIEFQHSKQVSHKKRMSGLKESFCPSSSLTNVEDPHHGKWASKYQRFDEIIPAQENIVPLFSSFEGKQGWADRKRKCAFFHVFCRDRKRYAEKCH